MRWDGTTEGSDERMEGGWIRKEEMIDVVKEEHKE